MIGGTESGCRYQFHAAIVHSGNDKGGHYVCFQRRYDKPGYILTDDSRVSASSVCDHNTQSQPFEVIDQQTAQRLLSKKQSLTRADEDLVANLLGSRTNTVVVVHFNIEMTTALIQCLQPLAWLNDEVINYYMALLDASRTVCYLFSTHFYPAMCRGGRYCYQNVQRWSTKALTSSTCK